MVWVWYPHVCGCQNLVTGVRPGRSGGQNQPVWMKLPEGKESEPHDLFLRLEGPSRQKPKAEGAQGSWLEAD